MGYRSVYREKESGQFFGMVHGYAVKVHLPEEAESAHYSQKGRENMLEALRLQYPRTEWEVVEIQF